MTPDEMRADINWKNAFYQAQHGQYCYLGESNNCMSILDNVIEIVAAVAGENDGPNWLALVKLDDGRYVKMSAGCDYTGWD